jgi:hypothetical protein
VVVVLKKSGEGPVLLFGTEELFDALNKEGSVTPIRITVDMIPDASFLRTKLDAADERGHYPVLVACDMFGMRGIDYRSRSIPL